MRPPEMLADGIDVVGPEGLQEPSLASLCRECGVARSAKRQRIVALLDAAGEPLEAEEIWNRLGGGRSMDRTSVYRTIRELLNAELIFELRQPRCRKLAFQRRSLSTTVKVADQDGNPLQTFPAGVLARQVETFLAGYGLLLAGAIELRARAAPGGGDRAGNQ